MDDPQSNQPDETQHVDLHEVDLADIDVSALPSERSLPPPLPPSPPSVAPPPPRSRAFYGGLLVAFLVVGVAGGIGIAAWLRTESPAPDAVQTERTNPSGVPSAPTAPVIMVPTIEMNDDEDDAGL